MAINSTANLFDSRLYRTVYTKGQNQSKLSGRFYPYSAYGSYVTDFYETPGALKKEKEQVVAENPNAANIGDFEKAIDARSKYIEEVNNKYREETKAPYSLVHPYAIVKLAGAFGSDTMLKDQPLFDKYNKRRFYEIDGDEKGGYAKNPTTTNIIRWGSEDFKGRTPYSFQDFVFCKYWNKIENNRMITLRRYAAPVTDALEFSDYQEVNSEKEATSGKGKKNEAWSPVATAVTYFGEETGNVLSDILSFSAHYNWQQKHVEKHPMEISSVQQEEGADLINESSFGTMGSGIRMFSKFLGMMDAFNPNSGFDAQLAARTTPPDPYTNGPYENRIMGPMNVIMDTIARERGLEFKQDNLVVKFDYVARPIAGINNKAVLLDLLSNMLVMCYASGTWFGGMWKYKTEDPAIYPFKYGDAMNQLYRGNIIGKESFVTKTLTHAFKDSKDFFSAYMGDALNALKNLMSGAIDLLTGVVTGNKEKKNEGKGKMNEASESNTTKGIQKIIASKMMKGATIPYISGQKALLTGDTTGDWHLTIGNPLNPIAMIGNLVVKDLKLKFYDELGPDDFPIGFSATVTLAHGLGRDRDAIESMFNRGQGRIYTLPEDFRTSADGETKIDEVTGSVNTKEGRTKYEETRNTFFGRGFRFIAKTETSELNNRGVYSTKELNQYESMIIAPEAEAIKRAEAGYVLTPWQTSMCL